LVHDVGVSRPRWIDVKGWPTTLLSPVFGLWIFFILLMVVRRYVKDEAVFEGLGRLLKDA